MILGSAKAALELLEKRSGNYSDRPVSPMIELYAPLLVSVFGTLIAYVSPQDWVGVGLWVHAIRTAVEATPPSLLAALPSRGRLQIPRRAAGGVREVPREPAREPGAARRPHPVVRATAIGAEIHPLTATLFSDV